MSEKEDPVGPPGGEPENDMTEIVGRAARLAFSKENPSPESGSILESEPDAGIRLVVETVKNPLSELSLVDARETAGEEVHIGDVLILPKQNSDGVR